MPCAWREKDGLRYLYADYREEPDLEGNGVGRAFLRGLQLLSGGKGGLAFATEEAALQYLARPDRPASRA